MVNSRYPRFSATLPGLEPRGLRTREGPPSPEVTVEICRVPSPGLTQAPWNVLPAHLCRFTVRSPKWLTSPRLFSEAWNHSVSGAIRHLHITSRSHVFRFVARRPPRKSSYGFEPRLVRARSIKGLDISSSVPAVRTIPGGAGILTCFPSATPLGLALGTG